MIWTVTHNVTWIHTPNQTIKDRAGPGSSGQGWAAPPGQGQAGPGKGGQVQAGLSRVGYQISSAGWGNGKMSKLKCQNENVNNVQKH